MDSSLENLSEEDSNAYIETMKLQHRIFTKEAFIYLLDHFGIQAKTQSEFQFFTEVTGLAVVTIAYAYRRRLRTLFRAVQINFADINEFKKFAEHFELIRDECYFFRILKRISHIFELTVYCLNEGHDYIEIACGIVAIGDSTENTEFFEVAGGFYRLNKTASFIVDVGGILLPVIRDEKPQDMVLRSYMAAVQALEMPHGNTMPPIRRGMLSVIKRQLMNKITDISGLDIRVAKVFYQVICQHTSKVIASCRSSRLENMYWREKQQVSIENEKEAIIDSFHIVFKIILGQTEYLNLSPPIKVAECFATLRHLTDLISPELDAAQATPEHETPSELSDEEKNCYSLKEYFIVSNDYVTGIERKLTGTSEQNSPDESYCEQPTRRDLYEKSMRKIIDANIKRNNYFKLKDDRYAVYTPDCKFDHTTTTILYN